jgi:4-alpha-glucanotransferase
MQKTPGNHPFLSRAAGVLLPIAALPGGRGIGDLGEGAARFLSWAASAGFSVWQILPIHPTDPWGSPYSGMSAFAGNPLLLDLADLARRGLIDRRALRRAPQLPRGSADYLRAAKHKGPLLDEAARAFLARGGGELAGELGAFRDREGPIWLDDAALHAALAAKRGGAPWWRWEEPLKRRRERALRDARAELAGEIERYAAIQFLFDVQWRALRERAQALGVRLFGDMPLYVDTAAADVWAHPELFSLDAKLAPRAVGGVPPDYFSRTGQKWGNPVFRWRAHRAERFRWWTARLAREAGLADLVRLDHFRGFSACYEIPAGAKDARAGCWTRSPGRELLAAASGALGGAPFAAEDLGEIDDDVLALRDAFDLPGMAVLQFAFGGDADSVHLPHNHRERLIAYTGTHDNDTLLGWWRTAGPEVRGRVRRYLGLRGDDERAICRRLVLACLGSVAGLAVLPVQDILGLGSEARTNVPGARPGASWLWRLFGGELDARRASGFRRLLEVFGRAPRADVS